MNNCGVMGYASGVDHDDNFLYIRSGTIVGSGLINGILSDVIR
jgi:hypothetical protein